MARWRTSDVKDLLKRCPSVRAVRRLVAPDEDDVRDWDEMVEALLVSFKGPAWCHVLGVPADDADGADAGDGGDFEARVAVVRRPPGWADWEGAKARELGLRDVLAGAGFAVEVR